jgi:prolipoprotein diacylglyceryltransferase
MDDGAKRDPKAMLRRAAREVPVAVVAYGLGYGIARTALETFLEKNPSAVGPMRKSLPLVLGGIAAYAGHRADKELQRRVVEGK